MAIKRASPKTRPPDEAPRFEAWLTDFDAREASLAAQIVALLFMRGANPDKLPDRETAYGEAPRHAGDLTVAAVATSQSRNSRIFGVSAVSTGPTR